MIHREQRARICRWILFPAFREDRDAYFGADGPTAAARRDARDDSELEREDRLLLRAALAFWDQDGGPGIGDVAKLDARYLVRVSSALNVLCNDGLGLDEWLEHNESFDRDQLASN